MDPFALEDRHVAPAVVDRMEIVADVEIALPQEEVRHDLEREVPELGGDGERTLAQVLGATGIACSPEILAQVCGGPPQSIPIPQGRGQRLRVAKVLEDPLVFAEGLERAPQVEPEVDPLLSVSRVSGRWRRAPSACSNPAAASR